MRGTTIGLFLVILVCVIVGVVYWTRLAEQPVPETVQPIRETAPVAAPPPVIEVVPPAAAPAPVPGPEPEQDPAAVTEEPASTVPEAAPENGDPFGGQPITVETLTGCKQIQQLGDAQLVVEFAPNGEWKMNGNVRAKWTIEGDRVKIYKDGSDEVHYIDIVNNKLVYDGKVVALTR